MQHPQNTETRIQETTNKKVKQVRRNHPASSKLYQWSPESHAPQQQPRALVKPPELFSRKDLSNLAV